MSRLESIAKLAKECNPLVAAVLMGAVYAVALLLIGQWSTGSSPGFAFNCLFLIAGAALGWLVGFIASPSSKQEAEEISKYIKVAVTALSGWGIAKSDDIKDFIKPLILTPMDANTTFRIVVFSPPLSWE